MIQNSSSSRPGLSAQTERVGGQPGRLLFVTERSEMARNRMIKPEFFTSRQVLGCSLEARLLFIGIWIFSDDGGNHPNCPVRLKVEIFPGDPYPATKVEEFLAELIDCGLVSTYVVDGEGFLHVTGWHHQTIRFPTYRHPPPPSGETPTVGPQEVCATNETKRNETKRNETTLNETTLNEIKRNQENDRSIVRTFVLGDLEKIDWTAVYDRCKLLAEKIHERWDQPETQHGNTTQVAERWRPGPDFVQRLTQASAIVQAGILPEEWLAEAVAAMLETWKPMKRAAGWIGKVLAATAREKYGVDFDSFKRAVTIPENE